MSSRWPPLAVGAVVVTISVAAGLHAANAAPDDAARPAPRPVQPAADVAPVPVGVSAAAREAGAGTLVASGPGLRVERIRLTQPQALSPGAAPVADVLRLTIQATFQVRDAALVVVVDGALAGRAVEAPDLKSASIVLPAALVRDGATIAYGYGEATSPTRIGTLTVAK